MFETNFLTPLHVASFNRTMADTFEYRLHTIKLKPSGATFAAQIYDGTNKIFETHGLEGEDALREAKQWIDEQDE
ncbi:MAG: hypothetical protein KF832_08850 [Caldilineaceae bacterium]|nr:hypothetical protein [Caldilineaceae bacterium]